MSTIITKNMWRHFKPDAFELEYQVPMNSYVFCNLNYELVQGARFDKLANEKHTMGYNCEIQIDVEPLNGNITMGDDGRTFFYQPDNNYQGKDFLSYRIINSMGQISEPKCIYFKVSSAYKTAGRIVKKTVKLDTIILHNGNSDTYNESSETLNQVKDRVIYGFNLLPNANYVLSIGGSWGDKFVGWLGMWGTTFYGGVHNAVNHLVGVFKTNEDGEIDSFVFNQPIDLNTLGVYDVFKDPTINGTVYILHHGNYLIEPYIDLYFQLSPVGNARSLAKDSNKLPFLWYDKSEYDKNNQVYPENDPKISDDILKLISKTNIESTALQNNKRKLQLLVNGMDTIKLKTLVSSADDTINHNPTSNLWIVRSESEYDNLYDPNNDTLVDLRYVKGYEVYITASGYIISEQSPVAYKSPDDIKILSKLNRYASSTSYLEPKKNKILFNKRILDYELDHDKLYEAFQSIDKRLLPVATYKAGRLPTSSYPIILYNGITQEMPIEVVPLTFSIMNIPKDVKKVALVALWNKKSPKYYVKTKTLEVYDVEYGGVSTSKVLKKNNETGKYYTEVMPSTQHIDGFDSSGNFIGVSNKYSDGIVGTVLREFDCSTIETEFQHVNVTIYFSGSYVINKLNLLGEDFIGSQVNLLDIFGFCVYPIVEDNVAYNGKPTLDDPINSIMSNLVGISYHLKAEYKDVSESLYNSIYIGSDNGQIKPTVCIPSELQMFKKSTILVPDIALVITRVNNSPYLVTWRLIDITNADPSVEGSLLEDYILENPDKEIFNDKIYETDSSMVCYEYTYGTNERISNEIPEFYPEVVSIHIKKAIDKSGCKNKTLTTNVYALVIAYQKNGATTNAEDIVAKVIDCQRCESVSAKSISFDLGDEYQYVHYGNITWDTASKINFTPKFIAYK